MPRASYILGKEREAYLAELRDAGRSEVTLKGYDYTLRTAFRAMEDAGLDANPRRIGRKEINWLRDEHMAGAAPRYKVNVVWTVINFCKWAGNPNLAKLKVSFGNVAPTKRVRWLENDQAMTLKLNAQGIEKMIVHCELDLGMRRVELLRLKVDDFQTGRMNQVNLLGKGRNGGKPRTISWHPETSTVLAGYLELREAEIEKATRRNPCEEIPRNLLVYERNGWLYAYQKSAIEKILNRLGERVGFHFSNHDLRRTCGRMMFRAGLKLEEIARIFGHSDTRTTLHYLGLDHEDMSNAMQKYARYQESLIVPKIGTFAKSQMESGQGGIRTPGFRLAKAAIFR